MRDAYLSQLAICRSRRGGRRIEFQLLRPLSVRVDDLHYRAPTRTVTDFASVPRLFRGLFNRLGPLLEASVIHDAAYRGVLQKRDAGVWGLARLTRRGADRLFHRLLRVGMGRVRASVLHRAVRLGGRRAWRAA